MSDSTDFVVADLALHLAASRNRQYRESTRAMFKTLVVFLEQHGLVVRSLMSEEAVLPQDFKLLRSDLTAEGFDFLRLSLHKWVGKVSAGKCEPTDGGFLAAELQRLRSSTASST